MRKVARINRNDSVRVSAVWHAAMTGAKMSVEPHRCVLSANVRGATIWLLCTCAGGEAAGEREAVFNSLLVRGSWECALKAKMTSA